MGLVRPPRTHLVVPFLIAVFFLSAGAHAKYGGGNGVPDDPYLIYTAAHLNAVGAEPDDWDMHFKLMADIDLNPNLPGGRIYTRALIAPDESDGNNMYSGTSFTGVFDGGGHVISNLTVDDGGAGNCHLGLFGRVSGAEIENLGLESASVTGGDDSQCLGLLSGSNHGRISDCYSSGTVSGGARSSGLGGLCGHTYGRISNCYSSADVVGGPDSLLIGGLCGLGNSDISNCYAIGRVAGDRHTGGLTGWGGGSGITDCFWDRRTSGQNTSAGGWSKTTAQMKAAATFVGWNDGSWVINEGRDYPRLAWEHTAGTPIPTGYPGRTYPGWGTLSRPLELDSPEDLICFSLRKPDWNSHVVLTGSIDMTGQLYYPIPEFAGSLDGRGFVISNLTIDASVIGRRNGLGLFGHVLGLGSQPEIKNVGLRDISIKGADCSLYAGGLCGINSGRISHCYSTGTITSGIDSGRFGGLCGDHSGEMTHCHSEVSIEGEGALGSLCGINSGSIDSCYSTGDVTGGAYADCVGGLCGINHGRISNSHSTGCVTGGARCSRMGGLCGYNDDADISNCYSTGDVAGGTGSYDLGGLCGCNDNANVSNCYSTGDVTGGADSRYLGGLCGHNDYGDIGSCYSTGDVTGETNTYDVGGLCGYNQCGDIAACYAEGSVQGRDHLGGLCGYNTGRLSYCYATSTVVGGGYSRDVGGLCGYNESEVVSCVWDIETSGRGNSVGGIGLLTWEMMDPLFYSFFGWANDPNWVLDAGRDTPRLAWEQTAGQIIPEPPADWIEGSGTAERPYQIVDFHQFSLIGKIDLFRDKHLCLAADIDFAGIATTPVGHYWQGGFTGVFDGNDFDIRNLMIDLPDSDDVGLFSRIEQGAVVRNLRVADANITGYESVGGLIGHNSGGRVAGCHFAGAVTGDSEVGGIVGRLVGENVAMVSDCHVAGTISGGDDVGGLVGLNEGGTIIACGWDGSVAGGWGVGGIVGCNTDQRIEPNMYIEGQIINCHSAQSDIAGDSSVGGIAGWNGHAVIAGCYAESRIAGAIGVGGLAGENLFGTIGNSYAAGSVTGEDGVGGLAGISGGEYEWENGEIVNCYSVAGVAGDVDAGGLVGINKRGEIAASFWDVQISGQATMCGFQADTARGCDDSHGKTTAEMQDPATFVDAGWDFDRPVWTIQPQEYPILAWTAPDPDGPRALSDRVFAITIGMGRRYGYPDDPLDATYNFWLEVLTDVGVEKVEFLTAYGRTYEIPRLQETEESILGGQRETEWEVDAESCAFEWDYEVRFESPSSLRAYNDGDYTVIVHYTDGGQDQTTVWFGVPGTDEPIVQPMQEPTFTSFAQGESVLSPLLVEWEPCVHPTVNFIDVGLENDETGQEEREQLGGDATGMTHPIVLGEGVWEAWLAFATLYNTQNADGIDVELVKYCESEYVLTVVPGP